MFLRLLLFAFYKTKLVYFITYTEVRSDAAKLFMWCFVSRKVGISTFSFRTILNVASDSKLTTIAADFDNGRIGKLSTGSRVQSFPRAFSFGVMFTLVVFYINCLLSKGTIVNVKLKTIRPNKLDVRKL